MDTGCLAALEQMRRPVGLKEIKPATWLLLHPAHLALAEGASPVCLPRAGPGNALRGQDPSCSLGRHEN